MIAAMQRRTVGLLLTALGAALVLIAVLTRSWLVAIDNEETVRLGLRDGEECARARDGERDVADCRRGELAQIFRREADREVWRRDEPPRDFGRPKTFVRLGAVTFWGGLAAGGALAAVALASLLGGARRLPRAAAAGIAAACAGVAVAAVLFVLLQPPLLIRLTLGLGLLGTLFGTGCGIVGVLLLARHDPGDEATIAPWSEGPPPTAAVVIGLAGAALVIAAIVTETWWTHSVREWDVGIGVRTLEWCQHRGTDDWGGRAYGGDATCTVATIRQLVTGEDRPRLFLAAGGAVYQLGVATIGLFLLGATLALLRQPVPPWWSPARWATGGAFALVTAGVVFITARPDDLSQSTMSYGPALAGLGAAALGTAGLLVSRWQPPLVATTALAAPPPGQLAPAAGVALPPQIPPCPKCGTALLWVTAQERWLCTACKHAQA